MRHWINIVENQSPFLYHGTSTDAAASIIAMNQLRAGDPDDGPEGISFSTDQGVADGFAHDVEERDAELVASYGDPVPIPKSDRGVLLVFDRAMVEQQYRLKSHKWDGADAEKEERVMAQSMNLSALRKIIASREAVAAWAAWHHEDGNEKMVSLLDAFSHNPLISWRG